MSKPVNEMKKNPPRSPAVAYLTRLRCPSDFAVGLLLGNDSLFGKLGGGDTNALEAVGDNAVAGGQQGDEHVHRRDGGAVVMIGPSLRFPQKAQGVVGKKLAVQ